MQIWAQHTPDTAPGEFADVLRAVGPEPKNLMSAIQGVLIHGEAMEHYGLQAQVFSRETLSVEKRLAAILMKDDRPLVFARMPQDRTPGTCRDYALMLCAGLREHGRPARVRCGFASYLSATQWEDHWICEVREADHWRRIDAQLDSVLRDVLGVAFSPDGLQPDEFIAADEAWRSYRAGQLDPGTLGHGDACGLWFVYVNLVRDRLALANTLTSHWDSWRQTMDHSPQLTTEMLSVADGLASQEPGLAPNLTPWWLDQRA